MMQPKHRLRRTHIHITTRVAPDTVVPANMQRGPLRHRVLQRVLELANRRVGRDVVEQVRRAHVRAGEEVVDVAAQAAWVVAEAVGLRVALDAQLGVHGRHERAEVDGQIGKGAFGHASAAWPCWDLLASDVAPGVRDGVAVPAHAPLVAAENGRVD